MRKVIVLFVIFVLAPVSIFAQEKVEKPIEVNISYGGPQAMLGWVGGAHTTFSALFCAPQSAPLSSRAMGP